MSDGTPDSAVGGDGDPQTHLVDMSDGVLQTQL